MTRIKSDAAFADEDRVEVIAALTGDVETRLAIAWGKVRLLVLVQTPGMDRMDPPPKARVPLQLAVFENAMVNRSAVGTQLYPLAVCESLWALLYGWSPSDQWQPLIVRGIEPVRKGKDDEESLFPEFVLNAETSTVIAVSV